MKDLRHAIPPTPDECRDAVLHAVSAYREEEICMKRKYMTALAAALLILLLCGTAYAISVFSVRDVVDTPSNAFVERIVPVEATQSSHGLTITLGDAVFDGRTMLASVTIDTAEGMQPVYILPRLEARDGDGNLLRNSGGLSAADQPAPLDFTVMSFGLLYPSADAEHPAPGQLVCKGFMNEPVTQDVQWTLALDLYTPNWPMQDSASIPVTDQDDYYEAARTLYEQGCIATSWGSIDQDWIDWAYMAHDYALPLRDILTKTGAFTHTDALTYAFTTPVFQPQTYRDDTIHQMDGFTIEVTDLRQTFLTLEYTLLFRYEESQIPEGDAAKMAEFDIEVTYLPEGMPFRSGSIELADDGLSAIYQGEVQYISDEPLTELTFTLDPRWTNTPQEPYPSFTVKLGK